MLGAAGAPQLPLVVEMAPNPAATPWLVYDADGIRGGGGSGHGRTKLAVPLMPAIRPVAGVVSVP